MLDTTRHAAHDAATAAAHLDDADRRAAEAAEAVERTLPDHLRRRAVEAEADRLDRDREGV